MTATYEQLAQAIGEVVLEWNHLETIVHDVALHLAIYRDRRYDDDSVFHPLHVTLSHMKMRQRILTAKALAHEVKSPPDYYDRLSKLLSLIDNDLTIERNRFVHDTWDIEENQVVRFALGPKVRIQTNTREFVMGTEKVFKDIDGVREFLVRLQEARNSLVDLDNELAGLVMRLDKPHE